MDAHRTVALSAAVTLAVVASACAPPADVAAPLPYTDSFSGCDGWSHDHTHHVRLGCKGGAYRIELTAPHIPQNMDHGLSQPVPAVQVSATIRGDAATEAEWHGVNCFRGPDEGYTFLIGGDSTWALIRQHLQRKPDVLAHGVDLDAIRQAPERNTVTLRCGRAGGSTRLAGDVNGHVLIVADQPESGRYDRIGVYALTGEAAATVDVDRISATVPAATPLARLHPTAATENLPPVRTFDDEWVAGSSARDRITVSPTRYTVRFRKPEEVMFPHDLSRAVDHLQISARIEQPHPAPNDGFGLACSDADGNEFAGIVDRADGAAELLALGPSVTPLHRARPIALHGGISRVTLQCWATSGSTGVGLMVDGKVVATHWFSTGPEAFTQVGVYLRATRPGSAVTYTHLAIRR